MCTSPWWMVELEIEEGDRKGVERTDELIDERRRPRFIGVPRRCCRRAQPSATLAYTALNQPTSIVSGSLETAHGVER